MGASTVGSACIRQRLVHLAFDGVVRQDDQVGLRLAFGGLTLQHGVDRDAVLGQDAGDAASTPALSATTQAQVERVTTSAMGRMGVSCIAPGWKPARGTRCRVGGVQARDVDQVGDHGAGGRLGTGALP